MRLPSPARKVLLFFLNSALLDKDIFTDLAVAVAPLEALIKRKFRSTRLACAPFPGTLLFHVAPFPVSTSIVDPFEITHYASSYVSSANLLRYKDIYLAFNFDPGAQMLKSMIDLRPTWPASQLRGCDQVKRNKFSLLDQSKVQGPIG